MSERPQFANNERFLSAMNAGRADIDRAHRERLSPTKGCAAEAAALATTLKGGDMTGRKSMHWKPAA